MLMAYTGNSAYCFTHSLHMCLTHAGMPDVPNVGVFECMTGMPFGAFFLQQELPMFFPSPSLVNPDDGLTRALETVGWTCEVRRFGNVDSAFEAVREALGRGPVLLGPLDMGYLSYDPDHTHKRGADHFLVALKIDGDLLQVHDPQFFPFALLPITDLKKAWDATGIGYAAAAYSFRCNFRSQRSVSRDQMLVETLKTAREAIGSTASGPVMYGGPQAFEMVASVLRTDPSDKFTEVLLSFALPLGARRCLDAACLFDAAGQSEAARLSVAKAEAYGHAQYYAVRNDWKATAAVFDSLSLTESQIANLI